MADLTFFLNSDAAAAHDCAYSAYWENTSAAVRHTLTTSRGTSAATITPCTRTNGQHLGIGCQLVSAAIATGRTWTTSDTIDFVIMCQDYAESGSSTLALSIRVFNAAGDTVIGTLYEGVINNVNWISGYRSRHNDGVAVQNTVVMPDNGHIVVEIGFHDPFAATFSNRLIIGEMSGGPLLLSDDQTDVDLYPWLAFTYGAPAGVNVALTGVCG